MSVYAQRQILVSIEFAMLMGEKNMYSILTLLQTN